jgi:hypothetical protein
MNKNNELPNQLIVIRSINKSDIVYVPYVTTVFTGSLFALYRARDWQRSYQELKQIHFFLI